VRSVVLAALLFPACRISPINVEATINETTATVVELSWTTTDPGISWVEYGTTEDYGMQTPPTAEASTDHHIPLYGLPPLSPVFYRVVTEIDGKQSVATGETETLGIPAEVPDLQVNINDAALTSSEPYMMGLLVGTMSAIFVLDREGNMVWYRELGSSIGEGTAVFGDVQFALDGNDIVYNRFSADIDDPNELNTIFRVALTGEIVDERAVPGHHHAFAQMGDGRYGYVAADVRDFQLPSGTKPEPVVGDAIIVVEPDGSTEEVFNTWDDWNAPVEVSEWAVPFYGNIPDWTHGNGLAYYDDDETFLLSAGYVKAVLEVDRNGGEVLRHFGLGGDVTVAPGSPDFVFQHDAHWLESGNMMMTSRYVPDTQHPTDTVIIGVEYALDGSQLVENWSYGKDAGIDSIAEGQARRMANGNTMINWGFSGICREVTPEGEVAWEMEAGMGAAMVRVRPMTSFYEGY